MLKYYVFNWVREFQMEVPFLVQTTSFTLFHNFQRGLQGVWIQME